MDFNVYLNTLRQKGNLAYEYNPLYNYLTDVDLYMYDNTYIIPYNLAINIENGELLYQEGNNWIDKRGNIIDENNIIVWNNSNCKLWAKAGSIIDLDTEKLNFDLNHPVEIEILPSYDGSVNLILNDDKNIPRIINSRFSVREKDTYEIVDRIGENDTNIYNSKNFDKDSSLYFLYEFNPTITYLGFIKGVLPVGQYCFYFTYCDADDNESDYIAESGLIPVFIGNDSDPFSMDGGIKNQLTNKGIQLRLNNIDKSYNYLKIYYVRYFADYNLSRVYECKKLYLKYPINSNTLYLQITGYENSETIDPNILNISRFNPKNILTLALCKNMLFFGNIVKNTDNYRELTDLALRIIPNLNKVSNFDKLDNQYYSSVGNGAYYNSLNIYNKTGYFNLEYYRFGVVFIYNNGTLSNVYNTLGGVLDGTPLELKSLDIYNSVNNILLKRNYIKSDDFGWIDNSIIEKGEHVNAKGVCLFKLNNYNDLDIISVKFTIPKEVSKYLKEELGIRGLFFVRQKCIPNIIAQCYVLPMDKTLEAPILETGSGDNKQYFTECFLGQKDNLVKNDYNLRLYKYKLSKSNSNYSISSDAFAGICPDFLLNLPYYNLIFNGGKFRVLKISNETSNLQNNSERFYIEGEDVGYTISDTYKKVTITSVTENVQTVAIKDLVFRLEIGKTEEPYRFEYAEIDNGTLDLGSDTDTEEINNATNLVRSKFSPYLAIYSEDGKLETGCLYNIYLDISVNISQEFQNRMDSSEPFYAISDRYNLVLEDQSYTCWRGDCYINLFTYRLNRNFNDPSLPNNDKIIDLNTWKDNYKIELTEKWTNISSSDINAVLLGSWITFKVRSAMNYALRSIDHSYVSEEALMGTPRSFYPRSLLLFRGENKLPDSYLYNDAYRASLGYKCYFTLQDINYIKDTFSNRILYSAIAILDSFKNSYRYSLSTYFRDYSQEYGSILKLIGFEGYILIIFEHAIGMAVINERVLAGSSDGEPVFINTLNVLPEELTIITDTYGTQWGDSVVKSEAGYVYGVDTIAKKIWRVRGQQIEILSDFKVNKFLVDNITLSEREVTPTIGLKNIKTHYNNNKKDIIFTFYDDIYKDEENVWSLCFNELLNVFVTFYSWIPSFSENIDTKFFTFDRNTSKQLALLRKCNYAIPENTGILLSPPILKDDVSNSTILSDIKLYYVTTNPNSYIDYTVLNIDGTTSSLRIKLTNTENNVGLYIINGVTADGELYQINFKLETDHWKNYKLFEIVKENEDWKLKIKLSEMSNAYKIFLELKVILLYITPYISELNNIITNTNYVTNFKTEVVALTLDSIIKNPLLTQDDRSRSGLVTDFYLHGLAGIFNVVENLYPTYWYGQNHPFEFEFVVNDKIGLLKIFNNLIMISNKAEPESFHFEIEGDNYEFSLDKRNMYFRQEATKNLYQNLGSNILYNRYYTDVVASKYTKEQHYRPNSTDYISSYINLDRVYPIYEEGLVQLVKSTIFPLYYERVDTYNDIYDKYILMHDDDGVYDFANLSGSEISWNRDLNQFNVITHIKNSPINLVGILRGNSKYKEGKWNIQIPSIAFMLKNEEKWPSVLDMPEDLKTEGPLNGFINLNVPPIVINSQNIPGDLKDPTVTDNIIPNIFITKNLLLDTCLSGYIDDSLWSRRKETRIRDKWMKVRIRYSGKNLAIIHSLVTLYNISYS